VFEEVSMGALDGVRVIDFGQYIAGPLTGMLLADQGAEVIKVDPPGGPVWDAAANATWNRGKRSIVLNLKHEGGVETARRLIDSADVVIENFRPGVMDRLGLGAEAMMAMRPQLVHCSLPGFASDDPRRDVRAWEGVVGAATATYFARGVFQMEDTPRPVYTAVPIASNYAAFQAAVAVSMALIARDPLQRNYSIAPARGQRIEVPLFDGMFTALGYRGQHPFGLRGLAGLRTTQYECGNGRWVQFHAGNQNVPEFMELAGISHWRDKGLFEPERHEELNKEFIALFKTRTAQEWEDLIAEAGSEATVCRTSEEWLAHPHARASEAIVEVEDPELGLTLQPGLNARMSTTPGAIRPRPRLDADREDILAELDEPSKEWSTPTESALRAALEGVRVLDLCIVLAGPTAGRTLAEYGADVIKIDAPYRSESIVFFTDVSRAKRSILLDLKTPEGLDVFWKLVDSADVVLQNYRAGAADRLGIGYEAVRERKPEIIYGSMNSYGHLGPWAGRPGHEQLAQAATGMQVRFGGDGPPMLQTNAINDYGTGLMGAYGVALALLHRKRTGEGQHIDSALAYTGVTLQAQLMTDYGGHIWDEAQGQDSLGDGPMHRAYEASDGWVFLGARREELERLEMVAGIEGLGALEGEVLEAALETAIASGTVDEWVSTLVAAGAGAHRVVEEPRDLMEDPWVIQHGLSVTREHMDRGPVTTTGPAARLSRTPVVSGRPAPTPGSDGREILEEIGLGDRFDGLVSSGVVRIEGVAAG
jgi:crotonobetainyl-CoA:carnitine CoA-transferase CaiB-like acyl-CoA transferase